MIGYAVRHGLIPPVEHETNRDSKIGSLQERSTTVDA
jgi:hypothetical protein